MAMLVLSLILVAQGAKDKIEGCSGMADSQAEEMAETGHALLQKKTEEDSIALDTVKEETRLEPMTLYALFNTAEVMCKGFNDNKWIKYTETVALCVRNGLFTSECAEKVCELSECCKLGKNTAKEMLDEVKEAFEDHHIEVDILQISAGELTNNSRHTSPGEVVQAMEKLCKKKNDQKESTENKMEAAFNACLPKFSHKPRNTKADLKECGAKICELSECCTAAKTTYECMDNIYQTIIEWKYPKELVIDLDDEKAVDKYLHEHAQKSCFASVFPHWK